MCGISLIAGVAGSDTSALRRMIAALGHRGPDANGVLVVPGCQLGHTRLSIIDLAAGAQPMTDVSGRYRITFNGEIYNYQALRAELLGKGYRFETHSDTEVIMTAYAEWGSGCLDRFRGMFAFAVWDTAERRLFAARDLFGEKPLYYATSADGALLLASEIKSLLASGLIEPRLDKLSVDAFLCLGYVPPDRTIYENVQTLPPAHYLEWRPGGDVRRTRYWKPVFKTSPLSIEDAGERLRELVEQAVQRQMVADVPVGAFLSGGHDSSTIVALMQRHTDRPVKTFSVGFGELINELPYARAVAELYKTEHHDIDLGSPPVAELMQRMAEVYDEPFMDPSHVPTYMVSEYARRYVKVVLSGDGADELFGGYSWYPLLSESTAVTGSWLAWVASRSLSRLVGDRSRALTRYSQAQGMAWRWGDPWVRYVRSKIGRNESERAGWWENGEDAVAFFPSSYYDPNDDATGMDRVLHYDLLSFLPGDILVKVDRAAMAHGLETRAPFLDRDLVEFALTLPASLKVTPRETKVLFKAALKRYWPEVIHNRKKQGFAGPHEAWLRRDDVGALVKRVFAPGSALRQLFPGVPPEIAQEGNYKTWNLLTLGLWLEQHGTALQN